MATGPEHYREAERLDAAAAAAFKAVRPETATFMAHRAQVHATLAQAAATAMSTDMGEIDFEAWDAVCGVQEDEHDEDQEVDDLAEADAWNEADADYAASLEPGIEADL